MKEKKIAKFGLLCSLAGLFSLYVTATQLRLGVTPIAKLNEDYIGTNVVVSGKVISLHGHQDGHLFLKLKDESEGVVSVPIFAKIRSQLSEPIELLDVVQVKGMVKEYRGELEVTPNKAEDLRIVVHTPPEPVPAIGKEKLGELIEVKASVEKRQIVGNGSLIFTLQEDGSQLPVFIPATVVRDGFPEVHVGDVVRVWGYLQLYGDELELKVTDPDHVHVARGR